MKDSQEVVFITGCSSGIGKASACFLAKHNFKVYASSRTPENIPKHENIYAVKLDITDRYSVKEAFENIQKIDVLINNAGYGLVSTLEDMDEEEMLNQYEVNVFGLLRVTKEVIPKMRKQNYGVIINISSFLGRIGLPLLTFYNSSKYAVEGITDSLRYELRDFNIRVHSIMPGFFDTNFARDNLVVNKKTFHPNSPYASLVSTLTPTIIEQINHGNCASDVSKLILKIIENDRFVAHVSVGDKARKFIPMKRELSDEDFERRVRAYYKL